MNRTLPAPSGSQPRPRAWALVAALAVFGSSAANVCAVRAQESVEHKVPIEVDRLAQDSFPIDDNDPERSVPSPEMAMRRPLQMGYFVMLLIERGEGALSKGNYNAAVKYYRALTKAVPERSRSHSLLCRAYEGAGDIEAAQASCRTALGTSGVTLEDNLRFVNLTLKKSGSLPAKDIEDVEAVITHLEKELGSPEANADTGDAGAPSGVATQEAKAKAVLLAAQLRCDLATRLEDIARLEACTQRLRNLAPKDAKTVVFAWVLALKKRDFSGAELLVAEAKRDGLPAAAIEKMEKGLSAQKDLDNPWKPLVRKWWGPLVGALAALALLAGFVLSRRRRSLRMA